MLPLIVRRHLNRPTHGEGVLSFACEPTHKIERVDIKKSNLNRPTFLFSFDSYINIILGTARDGEDNLPGKNREGYISRNICSIISSK